MLERHRSRQWASVTQMEQLVASIGGAAQRHALIGSGELTGARLGPE